MKNLLIVGGTGFIGYHTAIKAVELGYNVLILSRKSCPSYRYIPDVTYLQANVDNLEHLKWVLSDTKIEYVINLSGYVNHSDFFLDGLGVIHTHLYGLMNLLQSIDKNNILGFVQIGTSDEYGNARAPQSEYERERPYSSYSFAKTATSHFAQMIYRESGFPIVALRLFLVYGPGQNKERFIPQIIKGCLNDEEFPSSAGEQLKDFCYIDDIVDGILLALTTPKAFGEVINLSSGIPQPLRNVITYIKAEVGGGTPLWGKFPYRKNENMELYADIQKAKDILNWEPKTTLIRGLIKTIKYYREQNEKAIRIL